MFTSLLFFWGWCTLVRGFRVLADSNSLLSCVGIELSSSRRWIFAKQTDFKEIFSYLVDTATDILKHGIGDLRNIFRLVELQCCRIHVLPSLHLLGMVSIRFTRF